MAIPDTTTTPSAAEHETSHQILSATYSSPNNETFEHVHKLPTLTPDKVSDRTSYLGALRKATVDMQERINKELTARMEEDKVRETGNANGSKVDGGVIDEAKEEDNYGEEVVEEDD
ncbi:7b8ea994-7fbd-4e87-9ee2-35db97a2cd27-CDS [Sclerotinia trifoliorum]|uniref:EKC/KEOPS complex subunit GON7 n=1 Tax=Sclerotinia trifoliorum TaxID=28548 RepID=A0A8H2W1U0_9HELO|nr:7b8ea994-7fbd-4e87-9ee2-35db97a2cd27-CDS [Sclerotinia trifoliorum]